MSLATHRELFAFNDWANGKLLASAAGLDDERLDRPFQMGPGSLRRTLHHLWGAERAWLNRWKNIDRSRHAAAFDHPKPTLAELAGLFHRTAAERNVWLSGLGEADLDATITFEDSKGQSHTLPVRPLLVHVCNHGVHHRAQAINMLRHVGGALLKPGSDYIFFKVDQPDQPTPALDPDTIRRYYAYADWARERTLDAAERLSDAQLDRPFEMGMGSLRKTLAHIRDAEQWWLTNWTQGPGVPFPPADEKARIADVRGSSRQIADQRNAMLDRMSPADPARIVSAQPRPGVTRTFPIGVTMLQLCCHGTHHRAQALNMFRHLGGPTPGLDYALWIRETAR